MPEHISDLIARLAALRFNYDLIQSPYVPPGTVYALRRDPSSYPRWTIPPSLTGVERMPPTLEPLTPTMTPTDDDSLRALINLNICPDPESLPSSRGMVPIRGGMWADTIDPYKFFLTKICEITPIIPPDHVWFGQVFHDLVSIGTMGDQWPFESLLTPQTVATVRQHLASTNTGTMFIDAVCRRLQQTSRKAVAAVQAMQALHVPGGTQTVWEYLTHPRWRNLLVEDKIYATLWGDPVILNPDRVVFDTQTNKIWVFDYKTTTREPTRRALPCAYEFQAQLNAYLINQHLGDFIRIFDLPTSTTFGGFVHVIVQQPTIVLSGIDRRNALDELNAGHDSSLVPTTAQVETAYEQRVLHWYRKTGPYSAATDPDRVLIHASHFNQSWQRIIGLGLPPRMERLRHLCSVPTREGLSVEFRWAPTGVGYFGDDDFEPAYGKLYGTPISMWSTIMAEEHLHIVRRSRPLLDLWQSPPPEAIRPAGMSPSLLGMTITPGANVPRILVPQ